MKNELSTPSPNRPQEILKELVGDKKYFRQILIGNKDFLEGKKEQIDHLDPQEKIIFLEKIFAILSDPDPLSVDQRDAGLELLSSMDLESVNRKKLEEVYRQAIKDLRENLSEDSDPYGEIHMLLEAGKIIAPFIEKNLGIIQSWRNVAKYFTGDNSQKISNDMAEIKQLIATPRKIFSEFDANVKIDVKNGLSDQAIAAKHGEDLKEVKKAIVRLRDKGMKSNRQEGSKPTEEQKKLHENVKNLRNDHWGNLAIAKKLKEPYKTIVGITRKLIEEKEIRKIKNSGPKKNA